MKQFDKDVLHWKDYDYVVVNDQLDKCCNEIINYIEHELKNNKINYDKDIIQKHINFLLN